MNDIDELKQFVEIHARSQNIPTARYREIVANVTHDRGDTEGSWVRAWSDAARELEAKGRPLDACRHYNMARFPFVDGPARQHALDRCVAAFDLWRRAQGDIEPLHVESPHGSLRCWTANLSPTRARPILLVTGGIVSVKEQWAPVLAQAKRLGMAGVVTEMPGVGENGLRYDADSWRMFPSVLDAVARHTPVESVYAVALSFSGHLALRAATHDDRIKGVITAGAPIEHFFSDTAWRRQVPRVTRDTLAHLARVAPDEVGAHMSEWGLGKDELAALDIPVAYMTSLRDEIIPPGDAEAVREHVRRLTLIGNDDVHGSPDHVVETRLWILLNLLRMSGRRGPQRAVLGTLWRVARTRNRFKEQGRVAERVNG
ncbi:alpha/beta fold hydrolase [Embleya sp. NPDC056575]|uniref:alpha/beta fold hydrolase n=1 Tax=unclassified Embleya TaxID=2699296 RepID=UPI00369E2B14